MEKETENRNFEQNTASLAQEAVWKEREEAEESEALNEQEETEESEASNEREETEESEVSNERGETEEPEALNELGKEKKTEKSVQMEKHVYRGLTDREVEERIAAGKVNHINNESNRTVKQIVLSNVFTFFNLINVVLFVMVLSVLSWKNMLFILIAIINTAISVFQELRAKKTLDSLKILTASHIDAIRNGNKMSIAVEELVTDDLMLLKTGSQIPADAVVIEGNLDVNESLLTGESDTIAKEKDSQVYSGSYVTAGRALCQVTRVGSESYMEQISKEAKEFKRYHSELRDNINRILKLISSIIVPIGILLFCKQYFLTGSSYENAILDTVAGVLGMIPEGLVLLTSMSLAMGVLQLARRKTLVQELYCIETLARVDTLCLDKTGTITEGRLCVDGIDPYLSETASASMKESGSKNLTLDNLPLRESAPEDVTSQEERIQKIMQRVLGTLSDENETFQALRQYVREPNAENRVLPKAKLVLPFSSERKFSGAVFEGEGTYLLGAYSFIFEKTDPYVLDLIQNYAREGYRVLVLAYSQEEMTDYTLVDGFQILGMIRMTDVIRKEAPEILQYFDEQGVELKVISGDDPVTVAAIAGKAGLKTADQWIDATTLDTEEEIAEAVSQYSVFGRVTPKQKKQMVLALKEQGRTVAMTGDGVNDVLALKEADCSIAMASGSDAAKNTANLVLLDSNFASMPHIVNEGRRVINNIRSAASMFLIKTGFSAILAILTIFIGYGYPFQPVQLSIISGCAVGIPSFFLQLEPNYTKTGKGFFKRVLRMSMPAALTISLVVFIITNIGTMLQVSEGMTSTICVLTTGWVYMMTLRKVYSPMTPYRKFVIYLMQTVYLICMVLGQGILDMKGLNFNAVIVVLAAINFSPMLIEVFEKLYDRALLWWEKRQAKKRKEKEAREPQKEKNKPVAVKSSRKVRQLVSQNQKHLRHWPKNTK